MIRYFNRKKNSIEVEKVLGDGFIKWGYENSVGKLIMNQFLAKPWFSQLYGWFQDQNFSAQKIENFVKNFQINMQDFEGAPYKTFNEFFIRPYKEGIRPFIQDQNQLPAFAEGRYFGFESAHPHQMFPIKGKALCAKDLLQNDEVSQSFENGPVMIARLCPVDYHRFHFPETGTVTSEWRVHGTLHSVNPIAINVRPNLFLENERHITVLETSNFGKLALVDVGATCVGKIVQTYKDKNVKRGQEKGYFLFGGSTVIILGEAGKWKPAQDILTNTKSGLETYIELGDQIADKI